MVFESRLGLTAADSSVAVVPLAHVTGVITNLTSIVRCAGTLIIASEFKASQFLHLAARERVTFTAMVPAMYNLCLLQTDLAAYDLSAWRIGGYGGAPMPTATIEKLTWALPNLQLFKCYGATETFSPSTMLPAKFTTSHIDSVASPAPARASLPLIRRVANYPPTKLASCGSMSSIVKATGTTRARPPRASLPATGIQEISALSTRTALCAYSTAPRT